MDDSGSHPMDSLLGSVNNQIGKHVEKMRDFEDTIQPELLSDEETPLGDAIKESCPRNTFNMEEIIVDIREECEVRTLMKKNSKKFSQCQKN